MTYTLVISQDSIIDLPVLTTFHYGFECYSLNNNLSQCYHDVIDYCDQHLFIECEGIMTNKNDYSLDIMFLVIEKCTHGDVRLSGYKYYGQVQVCFNGRWEAIDGYTNDDHSNVSKVVCQQLGFSNSG